MAVIAAATVTGLFPFRFALSPLSQARDKDFMVTDGIPGTSVAVDDADDLSGSLSRSPAFPCGAVYELKAHASTPGLLAAFADADGISPDSLTITRSGDLYGTTHEDGTHHSGTVFKIKAGTSPVVTVMRFDGKTVGSPVCGAVSDGAGNLYGIAGSRADGPDAFWASRSRQQGRGTSGLAGAALSPTLWAPAFLGPTFR